MDKFETVIRKKYCSLLDENIYLEEQYRITFKDGNKDRRIPRKSRCSNDSNCEDAKINCKWVNSTGRNYMLDVMEG